MPEAVKIKIKEELQEIKKKYRLDEKLNDFDRRLENCVEGFNFSLFSCIENLKANKVGKALEFIDKAIECQVKCETLLQDMDVVGSFMKGLINREFNDMLKDLRKAA